MADDRCICGLNGFAPGVCVDIDGAFWPGHGYAARASRPEPLSAEEIARYRQSVDDVTSRRGDDWTERPYWVRRLLATIDAPPGAALLGPVLDAHYEAHMTSDEDGHCERKCAAELARALAALPASPEDGLDVERLARAMHNGYEGEPCPDAVCPEIARWRRDAANLAREYAALKEPTP